jgi:hypothetical protein
VIVVAPLTLGALIVVGAVGGTVAYLALSALARHLGSSGRRPRAKVRGPVCYQAAVERHQSERFGFSSRVR